MLMFDTSEETFTTSEEACASPDLDSLKKMIRSSLRSTRTPLWDLPLRNLASLSVALLAFALLSLALHPTMSVAGASDSVGDLLFLRPFELTQPYSYLWSEEGLQVQSGYVAVFSVDPELSKIRQTQMKVLYADSRPVEIANGSNEDGRVVAIIPGPLDLSTARFYYGSTVLPERVDAAHGENELATAAAGGVLAIGPEQVQLAREAGGEVLRVSTIDDVYRYIADVLEVYSPSEQGLVESYRLIPE